MPAHALPSALEDANAFANLLASLAGKANVADEWDSTALADDVATISSEPRSKSLVGGDESTTAVAPPDSTIVTDPKVSKTASITFRLTQTERALLLRRATEAHLSVSDYLRSCIFEAETLRAQVKEALLQMRAATERQSSVLSDGKESPTQRGRFHFLSRWSVKQFEG